MDGTAVKAYGEDVSANAQDGIVAAEESLILCVWEEIQLAMPSRNHLIMHLEVL